MKGLAAFVMSGRWQALLVTVAGAGSVLFCWISAAVVALVTLRRGAAAGGWLFLWALLPAGALVLAYGDSGPLALLTGTTVLALVLRATVNLPLALLASVLVGAAAGLGMLAFGGDYLAQLVALFGDFLADMERQLSADGRELALPRPGAGQVAGTLGAGTAVTSVLCLLLARYWQAALYNPGGFGNEFRALRYPAGVGSVLLVAALGVASIDTAYRSWAMIAVIPLSAAGLALVHAWARRRGRGGGWLGAFYVAWVLLDPVKLVVVCLAVADGWLNFRRRWAGGADNAPDDRQD